MLFQLITALQVVDKCTLKKCSYFFQNTHTFTYPMNTARDVTMISPSLVTGSGHKILFVIALKDLPTVPSLYLLAVKSTDI